MFVSFSCASPFDIVNAAPSSPQPYPSDISRLHAISRPTRRPFPPPIDSMPHLVALRGLWHGNELQGHPYEYVPSGCVHSFHTGILVYLPQPQIDQLIPNHPRSATAPFSHRRSISHIKSRASALGDDSCGQKMGMPSRLNVSRRRLETITVVSDRQYFSLPLR